MGFNCLFIFPPCYVALCASKAQHRLGTENVSWCLEMSLFKTPFPRWRSVPPSFVFFFFFFFFLFYFFFFFFFVFCIFSDLLSKTMGCFSGCLMSSASIQKLFRGIYLAFKSSFDEFVWVKVFYPSYSSTILDLHP